MASGLLSLAINATKSYSTSTDITTLWNLGFGTVTAAALIHIGIPGTGSEGLLLNVLLANLPQVILSFLYMMYNGVFTCMLLSHEWNMFGYRQQPLRVTTPSGKQRSTYWLQLPYQYSLPLLILSGFMHWLVSQSLFLARIAMRGHRTLPLDGYDPEDEVITISTCGYSPIAIFFTIIVGSTMVTGLIANGFRRYRPGIPFASSCSAAISASCHPPADDIDAAILPIRWGEVRSKTQNGVAHCTLTSEKDVTMPAVGQLYA